MTAFISEIVGTFVLIALGLAVNANASLERAYGKGSGWVLVTLGWGLAVFCAVAVAGPFSGAHINPAVTVGLAVGGVFPWEEVPYYITAQMAGAALGAVVVWLNYKTHFDEEQDAATKLGVFSTRPAIRHVAVNFLSEATATFMLMLVIFYLTDAELVTDGGHTSKVGLGSVGAIPVAFLVMAIGMGFGGTTGYAINPARDLAPRIMHALLPIKGKGSGDWGYAWVPVLAPPAGAVLAGLVYRVLQHA